MFGNSKKMRLLLFDVDGTLCQSGQKISPEMAQLLRVISVKHTDMQLAVVGGGTYEKIKWQLSPVIRIFTCVMAENGLTSYNE
jgi:phosphomannomutase